MQAVEERQVAGMASKDDAAEHRCFWPGTSTTLMGTLTIHHTIFIMNLL